jgi:hypothetical protein
MSPLLALLPTTLTLTLLAPVVWLALRHPTRMPWFLAAGIYLALAALPGLVYGALSDSSSKTGLRRLWVRASAVALATVSLAAGATGLFEDFRVAGMALASFACALVLFGRSLSLQRVPPAPAPAPAQTSLSAAALAPGPAEPAKDSKKKRRKKK